ncbi:MAG: Glu/Leu/Phe/Val dehydrogenase [Planctomycetes bacterium]|nr:Glu/Leu/Phe/Val dehydrogenase [Planctomycetota bacterium]
MNITEIAVPGYERVARAEDPERGFTALIAVHDTTLGPALGGLRIWKYASVAEAQVDVLRLARGMTYKSAVARTGLGGGKAVIVGDARKDKSDALLSWMGRFIDSFAGRYITAEDVGTSVLDLDVIARETRHVAGRAREVGGSGDPSPWTALGTFVSMEAALLHQTGSAAFRGRKVAIQGMGHVGYWLARHLAEAGAQLLVADLDPARVERVVKEFAATAVPPDQILGAECDVLAPCALGAVLNDRTLPNLRCKVVCGAANNQLAEDRHGLLLKERGILYAPDYVVNAGGILNISVELAPGGYDSAQAEQKVRGIAQSLKGVLDRAQREGIPTARAADLEAQTLLAAARGKARAAS